MLENIVYLYARGPGYAVSVGRTGKLECNFIMRDIDRHYVQVADAHTEDREYRPLEAIRDNYPKYVVTTDALLQNRGGILHVNPVDFMRERKRF